MKSMTPLALLTNIAKKGLKNLKEWLLSLLLSLLLPFAKRTIHSKLLCKRLQPWKPIYLAIQQLKKVVRNLAPTPHLRIPQVVLGLGHVSGTRVSSLFSFLIDRTSSTDIWITSKAFGRNFHSQCWSSVSHKCSEGGREQGGRQESKGGWEPEGGWWESHESPLPMLSRTWKVRVTFLLKTIGSTPMAGSQGNLPHLINLMCQGHLRYCMNRMKIDYNKTFEEQHPPVITNIVREANPV